MSLSRRELLQRGALALAAGNIYSLLDALEAAPARAAVAAAAAPRPEQYLLGGLKVVRELGIDVIVPPLHHRVVTARVRVPGGAARLLKARTRLEAALTTLEKRYPATPAGLGVTVAWGLPYFRRLVPKTRRRTAVPRLPAGRHAPLEIEPQADARRARRDPFRERRPDSGARRRGRRVPLPQRRRGASRRCLRDCGELARRRVRGAQRAQRVRRRRLWRGPGAREADGARRGRPRSRIDRRRRADVPRLHVDAACGDGTGQDRELRDAARPDRPEAAELLERRCGDAPLASERGPRALVARCAVHDAARRDDAAGSVGA